MNGQIMIYQALRASSVEDSSDTDHDMIDIENLRAYDSDEITMDYDYNAPHAEPYDDLD